MTPEDEKDLFWAISGLEGCIQWLEEPHPERIVAYLLPGLRGSVAALQRIRAHLPPPQLSRQEQCNTPGVTGPIIYTLATPESLDKLTAQMEELRKDYRELRKDYLQLYARLTGLLEAQEKGMRSSDGRAL